MARHIIKTVCDKLGITESKLLSANRTACLVKARMLVVLLLERRGYTDERIGWLLNRTRPTITVMRNNAHDELRIYAAFRSDYELIKNAVDSQGNYPPYAFQSHNPKFDGQAPRQLIDSMREIAEELRNKGFSYKGELTYLNVIKI
ncbi:MAG: hypothetical protein HDS09_05510 [Bacteroides sp.]|nr:hypothetical protein [Bacteroides sp.]